jgi:predicted ABC-type ATPase
MEQPILYVLAGPNGIGKTTSAFDIIPAGVPIINSDEIAKQVRIAGLVKVNTQEYSNREAQRLVKEQLDQKATFAMETNLADEETWKFLIGVQKSGYGLHLVFLTTDNLALLHNRINERTLRGEHYVRPDVVEERWHTSLLLLKHYAAYPDVLQLIDNTASLTVIATKRNSHWQIATPLLPAWFTQYLAHHFTKQPAEMPARNLLSIEEVKERYLKNKKN